METPNILDITSIEPSLKHPAIFEKFDALSPGNAIVIRNDHDPRPLYYELLAWSGPIFQWKLLENGPETWKIEIVKKKATADEETVGEIISRDYRKARVLKSLGIDFSFGGNRTLQEACEQSGLSINEVLLQLTNPDFTSSEKKIDYIHWDIDFLAKYIIQIHHRLVETQTKFITEMAFKVAESNRLRNPEIGQVANMFADASKILKSNCHEEEEVLFPNIIKLATCDKKGTKINDEDFGKISSLIYLKQAESEKVADYFRRIRQLANGYVAPPYTSSFCPTLYKLMADYEDDMHLHLHLENNILFPKALKMEIKMQSTRINS